MTKRKQPKSCERCQQIAIRGQRYCKQCKETVLSEMKEAGYLESGGYGHKGQSRTRDMKEAVHETKYGSGHG